VSGLLVLEDGTVFAGSSVGARGAAVGEAVFTTGMSGYQEVVTDPSFCGQVVCFTAPMVGNYGVADERCESERVHARAVIMREARGPGWTDWLAARGIVALTGLDTRSLTLHLREHGAMRAAVASDGDRDGAQALLDAEPPMAGRALVAEVSAPTRYELPATVADGPRVAVVDYGVKRSLLSLLDAAGAVVSVFPHDVGVEPLLGFDAVVLSSGPGDPEPLAGEVATVRELLGRVPLFGVCLGHQLLALANGLETFKLRFGHRGANHPVVERATGRVLVTSQNHGFAVAAGSATATHASLYDGTVEGLAYPELRAASVQFHPEARPGPNDARPILERFVAEVRAAAA
jgi:carbamoyl-phosphate synthase small subunit